MSFNRRQTTRTDAAQPEAGRLAYEEDVRRKPTYASGLARPKWSALPAYVKDSWNRNPTPREWSDAR